MTDQSNTQENDPEAGCEEPCDPESSCDFCAPYWQRMVSEGYWDRERHCWTHKGWKEITK
jgi:hypothetical protein